MREQTSRFEVTGPIFTTIRGDGWGVHNFGNPCGSRLPKLQKSGWSIQVACEILFSRLILVTPSPQAVINKSLLSFTLCLHGDVCYLD